MLWSGWALVFRACLIDKLGVDMKIDPAQMHGYVEYASFLLAVTIVGITAAQNALYLLQLIVAFIALQGRRLVKMPKQAWQRLRDSTLPISMLAPAYNEEETVVENIRSMLDLALPEL